MKTQFKFWKPLARGIKALTSLFSFNETEKGETQEEKALRNQKESAFEVGRNGKPDCSNEVNAVTRICKTIERKVLSDINLDRIAVINKLERLKVKITKGEYYWKQVFIKKNLQKYAKPLFKIKQRFEKAVRNRHRLNLQLSNVQAKIYGLIGSSNKNTKSKNKNQSILKAMFITLEAVMIIPVLQFLGVPYYGLAAILSVFFSIILIWTASGIANQYEKNILKFRAWCVVGFTLLGSAVAMRIMGHSDNWLLTSILMIALYMLSILFSLQRKDQQSEINLTKTQKKLAYKIELEEAKIAEAKADRIEIEIYIDTQSQEQAENHINNLLDEQSALQTQEQIFNSKITDTMEYYKEYTALQIVETQKSFDKGALHKPITFDSTNDINTSWWRRIPSWLSVIAILFFVTSCETFTETSTETPIFKTSIFKKQEVYIGVVRDNSASIVIDNINKPQEQFDYIASYMRLDNIPAVGYQGHVTLTKIGGALRPWRKNIETPDIPNLAGRDVPQTNIDIKEFKTDLMNNVNELYQTSSDAVGTNIFYPIAQLLNDFADHKTAKKRLVLIQSDMKEESGLFSMVEPYLKDPDGILRDYEKIKKIMLDKISLKDLNGIEIVIAYPILDENTLAYNCTEFWAKIFREHNAKVTITPNL